MKMVLLAITLLGLAAGWTCGNGPDHDIVIQSIGGQNRLLARTEDQAPYRVWFEYQNFDLGSESSNTLFELVLAPAMNEYIRSHFTTLSVTQNLVVEQLTHCGQKIKVPPEHRHPGLEETDVIIYLTSDESIEKVAEAEVCRKEKESHVVAATLVVNPKLFQEMEYEDIVQEMYSQANLIFKNN